MELPTEDYVPTFDGLPKDLSMIVFGPPKVGKTTLGASFPKSLLIECEPGGAKYVQCRKVDVNSLDDLREAYKLLQGENEYETIVIDSLDRIAMWIEDSVAQTHGIKNMLDSTKNAAHWGDYSNRILGQLAAWKALGKRIIFLAHTKKIETDAQGLVISPKTISLYGQTAGRVMALVENIGHLYAQENEEGKTERILSFRAGTHIEAGSRHPSLTDKQIVLPVDNPYSALEALFKPSNGTVKKKAAAVAGRK